MNPIVGWMLRVVMWLGVAWLGLLPLGPLSAQETKLRETLKGHTAEVISVAYSPDGKTLASGSVNTTIKLWDVTTGKEMATFKGHTNVVQSVAYSPDGKTLASGQSANSNDNAKTYDQTIRLWDLTTIKQMAADPPKKDAGTDIKKLAQARVEAAFNAHNHAIHALQKGLPGVRAEDVYTWSVRGLNAQLDQSSKQEDRISALDDHLQRIQDLTKTVDWLTKWWGINLHRHSLPDGAGAGSVTR